MLKNNKQTNKQININSPYRCVSTSPGLRVPEGGVSDQTCHRRPGTVWTSTIQSSISPGASSICPEQALHYTHQAVGANFILLLMSVGSCVISVISCFF